MSDERILIDCHNGCTKTALRLAVLLMPLWFVTGGIGTFMTFTYGNYSGYWYFIPHFILFPSMLVMGLLATAHLLTYRITIANGLLVLPAFMSVAELKKLSCLTLGRSEFGHLQLQFFEEKRMLAFPLKKMNRVKLETLLRALEKTAPQCKIQPTILSDAFPALDVPTRLTERVAIKYQTREKMRQFIQSIKLHEKIFWRVWITFWFMPFILGAPFAVNQIANAVVHHDPYYGSSKLPWALSILSDAYGKFFSSLGTALSDSSTIYFNIAQHPLAVAIMSIGVIAALYSLVKYLLQPNLILAAPEGLSLTLRSCNHHFSNATTYWEDITSLTLSKKGDHSHIVIGRRRGGDLKLKLAALKDNNDKRKFLAVLDKWAPEAQRDPAFIEALMPAQTRSYTELWLQSLSTPPKRNRLAPLDDNQFLRDGEFRIVRQLGVGGQGVAYLAHVAERGESGLAHGERLVLKEFILPIYVEKNVRKQALERFENEAIMLQTLDHPQIVKMVDFFLEDHRGYLVLEHIDGLSLRTIIEENPDNPMHERMAVDLAMQMCSILHYLHALTPPVVHRDFTPDNLILNKDGVLKLIDFNVAQQRETTTSATVVGKHAYLPPEQFRGKPTIQSDIYAMGATLNFLLTGKDPEPLTTAHPILQRTDLNPMLDDIIAKCMELDLKKRYAQADQIMIDLSRYAKEGQIETSDLSICTNNKLET